MGKSRAEIQRTYRMRKLEKEGETYLEKERLRLQKYYVPVAERSKKDAKARREKVLQWVRKHRKEKQHSKQKVRQEQRNEPIISDENEISSTVTEAGCSSGTLQVKMAFSTPGYARIRKRISRATSKQRREIEKLKRENLNLTRKYKTECKRRLRLQTQQQKTHCETDTATENLTPRRRTQRDLIDNGINPSEVPQAVVKKLLLSNVIAAEVQCARNTAGKKGKRLINQIVAGGITKKYKMQRALSRRVGMNRRTLKTNTKACSVEFRSRNQLIRDQTRQSVVDFMSRDDNSREMPGKSDTKKLDGQQRQQRTLNDSLQNLFFKFQAEMSTLKMSLSTFCRLRPKNITLTKYLSKNKCLCQRHQNMALLLKCLKAQGATVPLNPEEYARRIDGEGPGKFLSEIQSANISYDKWQRVSCSDGKKRMKIVQHEISKQKFAEMFHQETAEFLEHTSRIHDQYKALCELKENLPNGHVIIQMDFAENFTCSSAEEVQSAYWNASLVTLHPVVLYFRSAEETLLHKSYIFVSDDGGHNAGSVYSFMKKLVPTIQEDIGPISWIHYWTDSPSSQYRNKSIFYIVSDHEHLLGVPASWNYFEAGHGKGPCDGIGGTSKRMADLSVRQGKAVIQDADDYYLWGIRFHTSSKYLFVKTTEIALVRSELEDLIKAAIPLKGTMKVHAVAPVARGKIVFRTTSCYCADCRCGRYHSDWIPGDILKISNLDTLATRQVPAQDNVDDAIPADAAETPEDVPSITSNADSSSVPVAPEDVPSSTSTADLESVPVAPEVGEFVAALYDKEWYIGVVKEIDDDEAECSISFMEKSMTQFKWPRREDEVWISFSDLLCVLKPPNAIGRYRRTFSFDENDVDLVLQKYQEFA